MGLYHFRCHLILLRGEDVSKGRKGKIYMGISPLSLSIRRSLSHSSSLNQRASPGSFSVVMPHSTFQAGLSPGSTEGKNGKLTTSSVALRMPVFPNLLATVYPSKSSNGCSMHSVQVLERISVERQDGVCLIHLVWTGIPTM